jgi:multidrug efflux pump subunit AcrA (membrane-fusion protein)
MKWKAILIPLAILILGFVSMRVLFSFKKEPEKRATVVRPKIVETEVVSLNDVPSEIVAFGRLTSAQPVLLYSEVSGVIEEGSVSFQPAQPFKRGDLLLKIDDRQIQLDLNSAKSDLLTALAQVLPEIKIDFPEEFDVWQKYFDNCGFQAELCPLPETKNQKIKLYLSRFNVYKLYFQAKNLEIILAKHKFFAPFDGSIVSADLRVGSTARPGTKLGEIINLEKMEVEVQIPSQDIQWIDKAKPVVFTSTDIQGQWTGKINRVGNNIDERTQTVQVFMTINKNGSKNLYNGVFLRAQIPGQKIENAFSLPRKALYSEKYVYLLKDGKLKYQEIGVARSETETVILNQGVATGDTIVVEVLQGVANGMPAMARMVANVNGGN